MKFVFNHKASQLTDALDISKEDLKEYKEKCISFSNHCAKNELKRSEIIEELQNHFSYNELLLISSKHIKSAVDEINCKTC